MILRNFPGMATQPDPDIVPCRLARNTVHGPDNSWIETRPGTLRLTQATQPGAESTSPAGQAIFYSMTVSTVSETILIVSASGTNGTSPRPGGIFAIDSGQVTSPSENQDAVSGGS